MVTEILPASQPEAISHAADILRNGGLVAFPTDTVYGLAARLFDGWAVEGLYLVKGRGPEKAIAVLLANLEQLNQAASQFPESARLLAKAFWPGPLTLVVPRRPEVPEQVSALPTIGVRIPAHPVALELLTATGPLAVTSANLSGSENTLSAEDVVGQLGGRIHLILDGGRSPGGLPSTVLDCTVTPPKLLRAGPITIEMIRQTIAHI